jgi:hypothetical protein
MARPRKAVMLEKNYTTHPMTVESVLGSKAIGTIASQETIIEESKEKNVKITLDKARPYGRVCGLHPKGAAYDQDGKLFKANGELIEED